MYLAPWHVILPPRKQKDNYSLTLQSCGFNVMVVRHAFKSLSSRLSLIIYSASSCSVLTRESLIQKVLYSVTLLTGITSRPKEGMKSISYLKHAATQQLAYPEFCSALLNSLHCLKGLTASLNFPTEVLLNKRALCCEKEATQLIES